MFHGRALRKFSRTSSHRRAMFRNMATSLFKYERLETTVAKAKDLRRVVEKLVTMAGEDTLHRRRRAYGYLMDKTVVHKLFAEIGPRYRSRPGGYVRVLRTRTRIGDAAELAVIELVKEEYKPQQKAKKQAQPGKTRSKKAAAPAAEKIADDSVEVSAEVKAE